ncbi:MAG: hypothetical protein KKA62_02855 [Nanoarchaeota archaeon]|nr:hypothetical protein [Nanoarchaeota archaeon]MBU1644601.1 hypothetical protein [Nanoarchaeota archaeon]MBU1976871.1 hypothetical protein [Nanoarchaeota archaeon]
MKKILFIFILIIIIFLVGCSGSEEIPVEEVTVEEPVIEEVVVEGVPVIEELVTPITCDYNSDCENDLLCIDGVCGTIADLYNTDCDNKCSVTEVALSTSDGEKYNLKLGQGSYSGAGALEWQLMSFPKYCDEDPLVPIKILKKSTGKILSEQVLTLHKGDTSKVVTHPTVTQIKFKVTLSDVTEDCS